MELCWQAAKSDRSCVYENTRRIEVRKTGTQMHSPGSGQIQALEERLHGPYGLMRGDVYPGYAAFH